MPQFAGLNRFREARRHRRVVLDVALALVATWLVAYTLRDPPGPPYPGPAWVSWAVGAAVGLPLLLRRRWSVPVLSWIVLVAASATFLGVGGAGALWVTYAPVAVAAYTVANLTDRTAVAVAALAGCLVAAAVTVPRFYRVHVPVGAAALHSEAPLWWQFELGTVAVQLVVVWAAGLVVHARRADRAEFARRSAVEAVAGERLRIARELHDILGHSMSLIAVKATVAGRLADAQPEHAKAALSTIEQTSQAAMAEIRRILGVLRPVSAGAAPEGPALTPLPGSADLPALAERLSGPELEVDLALTGTAGLSPGVDLAVFRIVQEALTNVVEHSESRHCRIVVRGLGDAVHVEIADDGPARTMPRGRPGGGQGLIGMRERIAAHGGTLSVGPAARGGFRVVAEIPRSEPRTAS
ncbi:sensor histidine kinase [Amycolatopsis rubida]|uniref:histidine kinase n=1 Tax=Amycolatopsis rubida TaxID=112413 RepID=A0A1I5SLE7_9PSEU|nr:sensor histidine kinase [Amycolatopsis rubida]SFP71327.1 Signal transduction histidine kinase [Amycolatopsis rubida]